jgi:hypothetical protein
MRMSKKVNISDFYDILITFEWKLTAQSIQLSKPLKLFPVL